MAGGEEDDRGWDGWMASPTQWTWVWVNSGSWWWTGRPGVLQFMGSERVRHDGATEMNWCCEKSKVRCTLEKAMATHSSTLAWRIPWTEEPGRLRSMGLQRVGKDWVTSLHSLHTLSLKKEMATHSSVLAWRIPWTEEPGWPWSTGSQRVSRTQLKWLSTHNVPNSMNSKYKKQRMTEWWKNRRKITMACFYIPLSL